MRTGRIRVLKAAMFASGVFSLYASLEAIPATEVSQRIQRSGDWRQKAEAG
jgi:hypothetical protein